MNSTPKKPKVKTPQQEAYRKRRDALASLEKYAKEAATQAKKQWKIDNPGNDDVDIFVMGKAYIRREKGKGLTKVILKLLDYTLLDIYAGHKQSEILNKVRPLFPEMEINANVWQRPFAPALMKQIKVRVKGSSNPIDIEGCKNLSEIRKRLAAHRLENAAIKIFQPRISIGADTVTINEKVYPLTRRKSGEYEYPCIRVLCKGRQVWIRMDALVSAIYSK